MRTRGFQSLRSLAVPRPRDTRDSSRQTRPHCGTTKSNGAYGGPGSSTRPPLLTRTLTSCSLLSCLSVDCLGKGPRALTSRVSHDRSRSSMIANDVFFVNPLAPIGPVNLNPPCLVRHLRFHKTHVVTLLSSWPRGARFAWPRGT